MRTAAQRLTQFMRHRTHVASSANRHCEAGLSAIESNNLKVENVDGDGLQFHRLALASQLVSGCAANFLRGKIRRHLLHLAVEVCGGRAHLLQRQSRPTVWPGSLALGVVGVRGKAEA